MHFLPLYWNLPSTDFFLIKVARSQCSTVTGAMLGKNGFQPKHKQNHTQDISKITSRIRKPEICL